MPKMQDWLAQNKNKFSFGVILITNVLVWNFYFGLPDGKLHVKFYDVGQGDAIFISTPAGFRILIDGGPDSRVLENLGKDIPFYSRKIDLLILTHPQADHLTGLVSIVKRYQITTLLISDSRNTTRQYQEWQKALETKKIKPKIVSQGDQILFPDNTKLKVWWPRKGVVTRDLNQHSVVVLLSYGEFDALLTGDADQKAQPYTAETRKIEVFKVPHHGSKTAINEQYVSWLSPEVSVISVGDKNNYGHPSEAIISYLLKIGSKVYRTDKNGTVEIVAGSNNWYTFPER